MILGPLAEAQMRRALAIRQGDPSIFFTHPLSAFLLGLTALLVVGPWAWKKLRPAPVPKA